MSKRRKKDERQDNVEQAYLDAIKEHLARSLPELARSLPGLRAMIEDILLRNRQARRVNRRAVLYGGNRTRREAWVEWYGRSLQKARALAALDERLPVPPQAGNSPSHSYERLEAWCRRAIKKLTAPPAESLRLETRALAQLIEHPDLTVTQLAKDVGCSRGHIYELRKVSNALAARKQGKDEYPRGRKDEPASDAPATDEG